MRVKILGHGTLAGGIRSLVPTVEENPDVLWVCHDIEGSMVPMILEMAVNQPDESCLVLVSSQVEPGGVAILEATWPRHSFAYSPENVRAASVAADFQHQPRIIVGTRNDKHHELLKELLSPFTARLVFTTIETAEFIKHALNGFLALSVAYANELALLAAKTGADMKQVTEGLRSDPRIGPLAYLRAGEPYGANLEREINNLDAICRDHDATLFSGIRDSNERHKLRNSVSH